MVRKPPVSRVESGQKQRSAPRDAPTSQAVAEMPPEATSRGERRKRETRERLLQAAFRLFAERPVDAVPINEITEAADVGFGSFYNHFASKEAIYEALLQRVFEEFADALDDLSKGIEDPAEILSMSIRHAIGRAKREPLWGKLLVQQSHQGDVIARGLGPRLLRDLQRGLDAGRFSAPDPLVTFIVVGSSVLGAVTAQTLPGADDVAALAGTGMHLRDLDVRTAAAVLHVLGLSRKEADAIARRPLPSVGERHQGAGQAGPA